MDDGITTELVERLKDVKGVRVVQNVGGKLRSVRTHVGKATALPTRELQVLEAARSLPQPFSWEQLCVAAWELDPRAFGLLNGMYPDSMKVTAYLYGRRGLVHRGLLRKIGERRFEVVGETPAA